MPYDIFGDPYDREQARLELEDRRRHRWFYAGLLLGFCVGIGFCAII